MNDKQLNEVLDLIRVNYKNFYKTESTQDKMLVLKTWKYQFSNIPQDIMFQALMQYMATEENYPPTIAHLNKIIFGMTNDKTIGADESFDRVLKLIRRYGTDLIGYKKACNEFTDIEKLIINEGYFRELGRSSSEESVLRGQYARRYDNRKESFVKEKRVELPNCDVLKLINDRKLIGG